jgi:uncharacterized phage-associated protein
MITANTVANYFLALAQDCEELITNLKLNKLVYYTQAWYLALHYQPIFGDEIEAWVHGPVIPTVYDAYKQFRWAPIIIDQLDIEQIKQQFNPEHLELLNDIEEVYLPETARALEQLTHSEDPWIQARGDLAPWESSHNIITHESMRAYYARKLTKDG